MLCTRYRPRYLQRTCCAHVTGRAADAHHATRAELRSSAVRPPAARRVRCAAEPRAGIHLGRQAGMMVEMSSRVTSYYSTSRTPHSITLHCSEMRMRVPAYLVTYFAAALPARPRREFEPVLTNLRPRRGGASQGGRWRQARALKKVETDTVSELRAYFVSHTARSPLYTIPSAVLT